MNIIFVLSLTHIKFLVINIKHDHFKVKRIKMPKIMQNMVVLMDPPWKEFDFSSTAGNMFLNRFCIDEDTAFELSGVYDLDEFYFTKSPFKRGV